MVQSATVALESATTETAGSPVPLMSHRSTRAVPPLTRMPLPAALVMVHPVTRTEAPRIDSIALTTAPPSVQSVRAPVAPMKATPPERTVQECISSSVPRSALTPYASFPPAWACSRQSRRRTEPLEQRSTVAP
jgi:hypothetical protein